MVRLTCRVFYQPGRNEMHQTFEGKSVFQAWASFFIFARKSVQATHLLIVSGEILDFHTSFKFLY